MLFRTLHSVSIELLPLVEMTRAQRLFSRATIRDVMEEVILQLDDIAILLLVRLCNHLASEPPAHQLHVAR